MSSLNTKGQQQFSYLIYTGVVLLLVLPIWLFNWFPAVDGPVHAYNADLIVKLLSGDWPNQAFFFEVNKRLDPNWFVHSFMAAASYLTSPEIAEKLVLTVYVLAFGAGWLYVIKSVNPANWQVAFLGLPFIANFTLHFGFYSFILSLAVTLFVFGYWFRHGESMRVARAIGFCLLLLLLYFTHVVSYVATLLGLGVLIAGQWGARFLGVRNGDEGLGKWFIRDFKQRLLPFALAVLPSFILFLMFFLPREVIVEPSNPPLIRLGHLFIVTQLVSFDYWALVLSGALGMILFGTVAYVVFNRFRHKGFRITDLLLFVVVAEVLLYLFTPDTLVVTPGGLPGGGLMQLRLSFYPFFVLLFWMASLPIKRRYLQLSQLAGVVITLGLLFMHISTYDTVNKYMREYTSVAKMMDKDSIYLPIRLNEHKYEADGSLISRRLDPFTHTGSYIALERNLTTLQNIEAMYGYFPLRFKQETNPYAIMGRLDVPTPKPDIATYEQAVGKEIDYITIWGRGEKTLTPEQVALYAEVEAFFERSYVSPNQLIELYERKSGV